MSEFGRGMNFGCGLIVAAMVAVGLLFAGMFALCGGLAVLGSRTKPTYPSGPYRVVSAKDSPAQRLVEVIVPETTTLADLQKWNTAIRKADHSGKPLFINYYWGTTGAENLVGNDPGTGEVLWLADVER